MSTVGDEFPKEQARVRKLLHAYHEIGPPGMFGAMMLEQALREADEAAISGDIVRILRAFQKLKDCA